jgi:hypothetical protein
MNFQPHDVVQLHDEHRKLAPVARLAGYSALGLSLLFLVCKPLGLKTFFGVLAAGTAIAQMQVAEAANKKEEELKLVQGLSWQAKKINWAQKIASELTQDSVAQASTGLNYEKWKEIPERITGMAFYAEPGTGKSSVADAVLGMITNHPSVGPAQVIVFNTNHEPGVHYEGVKVLTDFELIVKQMEYLLWEELEIRKQRLREGRGHENPWLIWLAEEWGDIQRQCKRFARLWKRPELLELASEFQIALGSQGRKYNILGLIVNQAKNTKANGAEGMGDYLEAFLNCLMGNVAIVRARQMGLGKEVVAALQSEAYPCLLDGVPVKHLTHGHYTERKRLQTPINKQPIRTRPLTIKVAGEEHLYQSSVAVMEQEDSPPEPPRRSGGNDGSDRPSQQPQQQSSQLEDPVSIFNRLYYNEPAVEPEQGTSDSTSLPSFTSLPSETDSELPQNSGSDDERIFSEIREGREVDKSMSTLISEIWGVSSGPSFTKKVAEYKRIVDLFAEEWALDLAEAEMSTRDILKTVWNVKQGDKEFKQRREQLKQIFESYAMEWPE